MTDKKYKPFEHPRWKDNPIPVTTKKGGELTPEQQKKDDEFKEGLKKMIKKNKHLPS